MKDRIKKYTDSLFTDIYDTKQLAELKEEISSNLLEKVNDLAASGYNEDDAFQKAISSLGDMNELIENLKRASEKKVKEDITKDVEIDKKHIIAYIAAAALLLFGAMTAGIVYLQRKDLRDTLGALMPFLMISIQLFLYFGLTQETKQTYGMKAKGALLYCLATAVLMFGVFTTSFVYFSGQQLFEVLATFMPFAIPSIIIYIYLGLTEKSREKMGDEWQKQWIEYYSNPKTMMIRGNISGALWIFSFAAFLLIGFSIGWKYSWIVFIIAVGFEVLIESYFMAKKNR